MIREPGSVILKNQQATKLVLSVAKELTRSFTSFRMTSHVRFFAIAQNDKRGILKRYPLGRQKNQPAQRVSLYLRTSSIPYFFWGFPSTSSKNVSSRSLPSAIFWRYLMKSMTSIPVIFLVLKAPNPRKASPIMLAASQCLL